MYEHQEFPRCWLDSTADGAERRSLPIFRRSVPAGTLPFDRRSQSDASNARTTGLFAFRRNQKLQLTIGNTFNAPFELIWFQSPT